MAAGANAVSATTPAIPATNLRRLMPRPQAQERSSYRLEPSGGKGWVAQSQCPLRVIRVVFGLFGQCQLCPPLATEKADMCHVCQVPLAAVSTCSNQHPTRSPRRRERAWRAESSDRASRPALPLSPVGRKLGIISHHQRLRGSRRRKQLL